LHERQESMARAHGKLILLGEHAVVYGVPAIAVGISAGVTAEAALAESSSLSLGELRATAADDSELGRAFSALLRALSAPPVRVEVTLGMPVGSGLGASAAIGVAIAKSVLECLYPHEAGPPLEGRVLEAAGAWENVFHGSASGIDAAAALHGGCLWFRKGEGVSPIPLGAELSLCVALAGPPASTRLMVESVAKLRARRTELVDKSLDGIRSLVENARLAIAAGDVHSLGKLMDLNQMILSGLFVSTDEIESACEAARSAGALGAKLTGAGGGGAVVALVEDDPEPVLAAFGGLGLKCFAARVSRAPRVES
jgi:mevalonate kinase